MHIDGVECVQQILEVESIDCSDSEAFETVVLLEVEGAPEVMEQDLIAASFLTSYNYFSEVTCDTERLIEITGTQVNNFTPTDRRLQLFFQFELIITGRCRGCIGECMCVARSSLILTDVSHCSRRHLAIR